MLFRSNVFINLFMGISLGANVLAARYYAAGRDREMSETVHTSIMLALISGVVMAFVGVFFAKGALELMDTPADVIDQSALYMRIYFMGMPFFMLYNYGAAILRAVGDTKRPLYFLIVSGVINAGLNMFLVIVFSLGVAGVAIATVVSQAISCVLVLRCLYKSEGSYQLRFSKLCLKKDYIITSGLTYQILENNIGYIYCESFSDGIGDGNLDQMLKKLEICDGLIIDVRNNGGGNLTTAQKLAARFTNEKVLVGYIRHKTGPGHNDFSDPEPVYQEPSNSIRWQKKAVVLTNRRSYSATNDFVNTMRQFPNVTTMGDTTGGGSGLPFSSEIPNGWSIRFSASPMFDPDMNQLEFGIEPDVKVDMTSEDMQQGKDTIIETAIKKLKN